MWGLLQTRRREKVCALQMIDVKYYVAVFELLRVTGKMFAYTGDVKVLCVVISLIGLFSINFVRYDQFGRVLTIPENLDGGAGFQIELV